MSAPAIAVDPAGVEPPFEQIRRQVAAGAASGVLAPGHKLPTVRQLAADLGIAANTVARAYRELESDGVIQTFGRRGTFIASRLVGDADATAAARGYVETVRRVGLSRDEAVRLVEQEWAR